MKELETGTLAATTNEAVIAEICYVLSSKKLPYNLTPQEIKERLVPVLSLKGLHIDHKRIVFDALDIYAEYPAIDFVDALNVAHMNDEGIKTIMSYDHHFGHIPGVSREEPDQVLQEILKSQPYLVAGRSK